MWFHCSAVGFTMKTNAAVEQHYSTILTPTFLPSLSSPLLQAQMLILTGYLEMGGWTPPNCKIKSASSWLDLTVLARAVVVTPERHLFVICTWSTAQPICVWEISGTKGESLGGQPVLQDCQHLRRVEILCCGCHFALLFSQRMYKSFSHRECSACRQDAPQQRGKGSIALGTYPAVHITSPAYTNKWSVGPSRQRVGVPCRHPASWRTEMILTAAAGSSNLRS